MENDPENYYREKVILYLPWSDQDLGIFQKDIQKLYRYNIEQIRGIESQYVNDIDLELEAIQKMVEEEFRISSENEDEAVAEKFAHLDHN